MGRVGSIGRRGSGRLSTRRNRRRMASIATVAAVVLAPLLAIPVTTAHALTTCDPGVRTRVWDGGGTSDAWEDDANWNPDGVPVATDRVCINTGTGVSVNGVTTVASLESQVPLTINNVLTLTSTSQGSTFGPTTLNGGIDGAAARTLVGPLTWNSGTIAGPGTFTIAAGASLHTTTNSCSHQLSAPLVNFGTIAEDGPNFSCNYIFFSDGSLDNAGTITLGDSQGLFQFGGTNSIHNRVGATIATDAVTNSTTINVPLDNDGTITAASGTLSLQADVPPGQTSTGTLTAAAGALLNIDAPIHTAGQITGPGTIAINSTLTPAGTLSTSTAGTFVLNGTLDLPTGAQFINHGTFDWNFGTIAGPGTFTVAAGASLHTTTSSCGHQLSAPLVNFGTIAEDGPIFCNYMVLTDGSIDNAGTITIADSQGFVEFGGTNSIHNRAGAAITTDAVTNTAFIQVPIDNDGTIIATSGTLSLQGDVPPGQTSTGTLTAAAGAQLNIDAPIHTAGQITGPGTIAINSTLTPAGTLSTSTAGTFVLNGTLDLPAGAQFINHGTFNWNFGTIAGAGTFTVAAGASLHATASSCGGRVLSAPLVNFGTIIVEQPNFFCNSIGLLDGSIDNAGTITLTDGQGFFESGGTNSIHNRVGATITTQAITNTAFIQVPLDNDGTITATSGTLSVGPVTDYNAGTETLSGGTWVATGSATMQLTNVNGITTLDAVFVRDGAGASIIDTSSFDPLRDLTTITANGGVTIRNGADQTTPGPLTTAGSVRVGPGSAFTSTGLYKQTAGTTSIEAATGSLTATGSRVDVLGGTLTGKGQVQSEVRAFGGTINPVVGNVTTGGAGVLAVTGPSSLDATGGFSARLNGTTAGGSGVGLGYPQLSTTGTLTLGGTLTLSKGPNLTPVDGTVFTLATGASRTGTFANIATDASFAGWRFTETDTATAARVTIHQVVGPDLVSTAAATTSAFADGTAGTWKVTVANGGNATTSGTVTATLTLGAGQTLGSATGTGWSCTGTGTVTCTRSGAIAAGGTAPVITVTATATGVSSTTLQSHVSGGGDAFAGNNDFTATVPVKVLVVPVARILPTSPTTGAAPLTVSLDAGTSTCPAACTFHWDFGDGSTAIGTNVTHTYLTPGVYSATLLATNEVLTDTKALTITVLDTPPLQANAGDDRTVPAGTALTFDGRTSTPATGITYAWNFGDATQGSGATPTHTYAACDCDRTVTLTVHRGVETSTDTLVVHVVTTNAPGLTVTVSSGPGPISGADVVIIDSGGSRYPGLTNAAGSANLKGLADGKYTVYAWRDGFLPQKAPATIDDGTGAVTITLASGAVAATTLEARRLTFDEIVAAGIDPNDPANQNVVEFTICLAFGSASCTTTISGIENGDGDIFNPTFGGGGGGGGGTCSVTSCSFSTPDGHQVYVNFPPPNGGPPQAVFIILPGKARWLKEFFEVRMVVANMAPPGFTFVNGHATLDLPKGLVLAPTANPQSATKSVADVDGGADGNATWLIRGDAEGSYGLSVHYSGTLDPIGNSLDLSASTLKDLRVWGLSAISLEAAADTAATAHAPYNVRVRMTNITNTAPDPDDRITIYNPAIALDRSAQGGTFIFQPDERFEQSTDQIAAGGSFDANYTLIPNFTLPLNLAGSLLSALHSEVSGSVGIVPAITGLTPVAPLAFTATASDLVHLAWAPVAGATDYVVYRTPTDLTPFASPPVPVATVSAVGTGTQSTSVVGTTTGAWYAINSVGAGGAATLRHSLVFVPPGSCTGACATGVFRITTTNLPAGTVKQPYSFTVTAADGKAPYAWSKIGKLPRGLKLKAKTGVITGTPKLAGTFTFTIRVKDKSKPKKTVTAPVSIVVH